MSSNNDNAMARFLFCILQQKDLKDVSVLGYAGYAVYISRPPRLTSKQIDWNKVAHNPILTQEITNGHAARMRYSRFRASLLGIEPQRRNRGPNKSKVTKSKKDPKGKKEKEDQVTSELNAASLARHDDLKTHIKNEAVVKTEVQRSQSHVQSRLTPADLPPISMADSQLHFHNRLMTPCSDTDLFGPASGFATSPASDMLHHDQPFDYAGPASVSHCGGAHDHSSWQPSPSYSPFQMAPYEIESYSAPGAFSDHHQHTPHPEGYGVAPSAMMAGPDHIHTPVKHEEWDTHLH